jgi:hypothetical protein
VKKGKPSPFRGRHHTEEAKRKLREYWLSRRPKITREELVRLYWDENKTIKEIAEIYGTTPYMISNMMDDFKIPRKLGHYNHLGKVDIPDTPFKVSWEYIGGFFDGEGSIGIHRTKKQFIPRIAITNNNFEILNKIALFLTENKIKVKIRPRKRYKPNYSQGYALEITNYVNTKLFLENVYPYLFVKKPHAKLMLEIIKMRIKTPSRKGFKLHESTYTQEEIKLIEQLREMNRRGSRNIN